MEEDIEYENYLEQIEYNSNVKPPTRENSHLPFSDISWSSFEALIVRIANLHFQKARIFGKSGVKQYGIDIWAQKSSHQKENNEYAFIQCKRVNSFTVADLNEAIKKFTKGKFGRNPSTIILCFSKDLNHYKGIELAYFEKQQELKSLGFEFEIWDAQWLEQFLKSRPQLVYDIFDRNFDASFTNIFCGEAVAKYIVKFLPFPDKHVEPIGYHIQRAVRKYGDNENYLTSIDKEKMGTTLFHLLTNGIEKIFLLSTAGAGKSKELDWLEWQLVKNSKLYPIKIQLRDYTGEDLQNYLTMFCKDLFHYDLSRIVLLLDGYDEVQAPYLDILRSKLNALTNTGGKYSNIKIVLTSRTNFFSAKFENFKAYYLEDISEAKLDQYLKAVLKDKINVFNAKIKQGKLKSLIGNAFNLIQLVKIFLKDGPSNFPNNRAQIIARILEIKIDEEIERKATLLNELTENKEFIIPLAEKVAFSLEQLGTNSISRNDIKRLLPLANELRLLEQSSLLVKTSIVSDIWIFEHNNFQEFLAASVLARLNFQEVKELIAFEPDYIRIKPRWVNTLSILLNILSEHPQKFDELLFWVISIEPEIVIKFEKELMTSGLRFKILKKIFEYNESIDNLLYSQTIRDEEIANFGGDIKEFREYLIQQLSICKNDFALRNVLITVQHLNTALLRGHNFVEPISEIIKDKKWETATVHEAVDCILTHKSGDKNVISFIINNCSEKHDDAIQYTLINDIQENNLCEEFLEFILQGTILIHQNKGRTRMSNDYWLIVRCLHQCTSPNSILSIIKFIIEHHNLEIVQNYNHKYQGENNIIICEEFINNCIHAYYQEPSLYNQMIELAKTINKEIIDIAKSHVRNFFIKTKTCQKAFDELIKLTESDKSSHAFADVVGPDIFDYVIEKIKLGLYGRQITWSIIYSFSRSNEIHYHDEFYAKLNLATDNKFTYAKPVDTEKTNERQNQGDLDILKNKTQFLSEIQTIFKSFEQEELSENDLYSWKKNKFSEEGLPHTVVIRFLQELTADNTSITFEFAKEEFCKIDWDSYVINQILKKLQNNKSIGNWHTDYALNWCNANLPSCHFEISENDKGEISYRYREYWISKLWIHLNFPVDESIMLQMLHFDFSDIYEIHNSDGTSKTLNDYIIERFPNGVKLREYILELISNKNLRRGLKGALIKQCGKLHIIESYERIFEIILNQEISNMAINSALEILIKLNSSKVNLIHLLALTDLSEHWHWTVIENLKDMQCEMVMVHLEKCWKSKRSSENPITAAMIMLIVYGNIEAWHFLVRLSQEKRTFAIGSSRELDLTKLLLSKDDLIVKDLFILLVDSFSSDFINRLGSYNHEVADTIFWVAMNSDKDFRLVNHYFEITIASYKEKIPQINSLRPLQKRIERQFYINKGDSITIEEVEKNNRQIFAKIL